MMYAGENYQRNLLYMKLHFHEEQKINDLELLLSLHFS